MKRWAFRRAMSMVEMLVVVAIIVVLIAVLANHYRDAIAKTRSLKYQVEGRQHSLRSEARRIERGRQRIEYDDQTDEEEEGDGVGEDDGEGDDSDSDSDSDSDGDAGEAGG